MKDKPDEPVRVPWVEYQRIMLHNEKLESRIAKVRAWAKRGVNLAYLADDVTDEEYIRARCSAEVLEALDG